ncbi:MAG: hypothetical protein HYX53_09580 [Chloroflexi bacterium]|nr:hypothetical protein [Chloroflexota bacterium]
MAVAKVSVSFPPDLAEKARASASEHGETLSRWLAKSAADRLRFEALVKYNEEMERKYGPVPDEEIEDLRRQWRG